MEKKAIALLSGGLDSALACELTLRRGFQVVGLNLATGFCVGEGRCDTVLALAARLGIPLRMRDVSAEFLEVVRAPKFGYGSGMNPCLDCRILMARTAGAVMEEEGASFVVTGEVLGQRPMSQHRRALDLVAEESGLGERLVRPLSGRLLGPTYPERMGWIRREDWLDIQGRSRKRQLALAREWGLTEFVQPSGGCCLLLTKAYAVRLRDAFRHRGREALTPDDFALLRYGRHFRLSPGVKVIVGRDEGENAVLAGFSPGRWALSFPAVPGPVALVEGDLSPEELELAARLAARYSDARGGDPVTVRAVRDGREQDLTVVPLPPDDPRIASWALGE
ncbi:MAG: hypothetical protein N2320_00690 [Candidatus Bipolaricaulota bacterium]|nr:hypothetical protein [Candidatus Bipolaricaulota bacterium]